MLAERVIQWTEDWLEEGRQVGLEQGLQKAALALARRNCTVAEIAAELEVSQEVVERMLQQR